MGTASQHPPFDARTLHLIDAKAARLVGQAGFTRDDLPDLKQELGLALWRAMPKFDRRRSSWPTFASLVLDTTATKLIEHQQAQLRDWRRCSYSLNERLLLDGEETERGDLLGAGDTADVPAMPLEDRVLMRLALQRALTRLSPEDRKLYVRVVMAASLTALANEMGVPRTTLHDRWRRIQAVFEAEGLRSYL